MRANVIIATVGRASLLDRALKALAEQDLPAEHFSVEVVIDGSDAGSVAVLSRFAGGSLQIRWRETGVRKGPAAARNIAIQSTSAPIVAITDDDCVPGPGWLSAFLDRFDSEPETGVLVGKTTTDRGNLNPFSHYVENLEGATHQTCNIAYRRDLLERLGGFDDQFPFSLEDTDLFLRAEQVARTGFEPTAVVHHPPRELSVAAVARSARRFEGDFLFFNKHPEWYRQRHGGMAPLPAVLWEVGLRHVLKQLLIWMPLFRKRPDQYLRYVLALIWFEGVLWTHTPFYWWRHRGGCGSESRRLGNADQGS